MTKDHKLGSLSNTYLFLTVLEAEDFKVKAQADLVSGEGLFHGSHLLLVTSRGRRDKQALWVSRKGASPIHEGSVLLI